MTESISYRGAHEQATAATEIAAYRQTGMQHIEEAANLLAHTQEYGSSALLGVDEEHAESLRQDVYWLAHHAHGLKVLAVDHVVGTLHGPATSRTFRHIDDFAFTHGKSGLIVFNNVDALIEGSTCRSVRAQEVAARHIARLIAHESRPRICAISNEIPAEPQRERLLGVFASYVTFGGTKDEVTEAATPRSTDRQLQYA